MCTAIKAKPLHVERQPGMVLYERGLDADRKKVFCDECNLLIEPARAMTVLKEGRDVKIVHLQCANGHPPLTAEQVDHALDRKFGPRTRTPAKAK